MAEPRLRCIHGHKLSDVGVYVQPSTGKEFCRECKRLKARAAYWKSKGVTELPPKRVWTKKSHVAKPGRPSPYSRFMARVEFEGDHWMWTGCPTLVIDGRDETAGRASMMLLGEGLAAGPLMQVRSTCGETRCVHPDHLANVSCTPARPCLERYCDCGRQLSGRARTCPKCRSGRSGDYYITEADREYVYKRDGHACLKCGTDENLTVDHILPRILGGLDLRDNYQTLCLSCNASKGATYADYRHGSNGQMGLALQPMKPDLRARFLAKVDQRPDGCWVWTGAKVSTGNGAMNIDGRVVTAVRVSHELFVAPLNADSQVYRTCDTDGCVAPKCLSLEPRKRTHCRNGHAYTDDNTAMHGDQRRCLTCRRSSSAAHRERQALVS